MIATATRPILDPLIDAPLVGPRVLTFVGEWAIACNMWRVWQPAAMLQLHGYPAAWGWHRDRENGRFLGDFDAYTFCRMSWGGGRRGRRGTVDWLRKTHATGRKVFYETDDDLFTPFGEQHQRGRIAAQDGPRARSDAELREDTAAARWVVERVDGVTVSTQYLASLVRRFTSAPVEVVPNAIDAAWFRERQRGVPRPVPGLTIGWAGGNRPDGDFAVMAEAWAALARHYPRVTFLVVGHQSPLLHRVMPPGRLVQLPWREPADYPRGLAGIDIGCCPLADVPFNRAKTPIKAWEYALSGAAVVASPTVYGACIDPLRRQNGLLATSAGEWEGALSILVEDADQRRARQQALEQDVLARWSLGRNYWRWPAAWQRLWEASA